MLWVAGEGLSTFLKGMRGGAGGKSLLSWGRSEIFLISRMGMACCVQHQIQRRCGEQVMLILKVLPLQSLSYLPAKSESLPSWRFRAGATIAWRWRRSSLPEVPVEVKHRVLSVKEKKLYRSEKPSVKVPCDRCDAENVEEGMGVSRLPENSAARGKKDIFLGDHSADFQLTGVVHTFPSLLLWKSQLEKLKADVDQVLSRVCEELSSFGPGLKSKGVGQKNKTKKKKRRLRWVPKVSKPIS
jgi:hypothetical protein